MHAYFTFYLSVQKADTYIQLCYSAMESHSDCDIEHKFHDDINEVYVSYEWKDLAM